MKEGRQVTSDAEVEKVKMDHKVLEDLPVQWETKDSLDQVEVKERRAI